MAHKYFEFIFSRLRQKTQA